MAYRQSVSYTLKFETHRNSCPQGDIHTAQDDKVHDNIILEMWPGKDQETALFDPVAP